jgi:hypothetical protein
MNTLPEKIETPFQTKDELRSRPKVNSIPDDENSIPDVENSIPEQS